MSTVFSSEAMRDTVQQVVESADSSGSGEPITFRILGTLTVHADGRDLGLSGPAQKALLAFLLLNANRPLSNDIVAKALWGAGAGDSVKRLQMAVARLRKVLKPLAPSDEESILQRVDGGYLLDVAAHAIDADVFEKRVRLGRGALEAGDAAGAASVLREAEALWRGPALVDVALQGFAQDEIRRLDELRLGALEARVDADLALDRHPELVGELEALVTANPDRDRFAAQLMLALYRCGRQVEALEVYQRARTHLAGGLGLDPGPELQRMQARILNQDPTLLRVAGTPLPVELEASATVALAGRRREYGWLRQRWDRARAGRPSIVAITGPSGIGKTRLAAELARELHQTGATVRYIAGDGPADVVPDALRASEPTLLVIDGVEDFAPATLEPLHSIEANVPVLTILIATEQDSLTALPVEAELKLQPLDEDAVAAIARGYIPRGFDGEPPVGWLYETSGGVPAQVHAASRQWARRENARRVGITAHKTATGRAELRSMEAELADEVAELRTSDSRGAAGSRETVVCPFKGLAAFDIDEAKYFYGRERLTAELVARLVGTPLLGVIGPSGSGKSSVMRAGLLPALAEGILPGSDQWRPVIVRPGEHPPQNLDALVGDERFVLAVDQFEELFTVCQDEAERTRFIDQLVRLAAAGRGVVVLALRADQYGRCAEHPALSRLLAANHVLVPPMTRDEVRRAIECPAEQAGLTVEPELTDRLMADVERQPGGLPLLSTALLELWRRRDGRRLRLSAYEETGGVSGAVARLAENAFLQLSPAQQPLARDVLTRLVSEGAEDGVERRRIRLAELEEAPELASVANELADARLLTVSDGTIELAHEALLREWPRLSDWIAEDRDDLRIHRNVNAAAREWVRLDRDDGALYRGTALSVALEWSARRRPGLNQAEREFLDASQTQRRRERSARRRWVRVAAGAFSLVLVVVAVAAVVTVQQRREAARTASRDLANQSSLVRASDPGLALGVALWADDRRDTAEARTAVRQATLAARGTAVWPTHDGAAYGSPSRDGREFVTGGADGKIRLWDLQRHRALATFSERGEIKDAALSPNGELIASAGTDAGVVVRARDGSDRRIVLYVADTEPVRVAFSQDGQHLVVAMSDGNVQVAGVQKGDDVQTLKGHGAPITDARFDRDGTHVVSSSADATARIWDLGSGTAIELSHPAGVMSADFSPDGRQVATIAQDGLIRIWDASTGDKVSEFPGDTQGMALVRFNAGGDKLAAAGLSGAVTLWDSASGAALGTMGSHRGWALGAYFLPGDKTIASTGEDGTLRLWTPPVARTIATPITNLSLSRDGRLVAGGSIEGAIIIADPAKETSRELASFPETSTMARFTPDGSRVVGVSTDGIIRLWDPVTGRGRDVPPKEGPKFSVAATANGRLIAFGDGDGNVTVERPDGTGKIVLKGHRGPIYDVNFSPDGHRLISASGDGMARVWNVDDGRLERVLRGHGEDVNAAVFSHDGRRAATAGGDATIRVWKLDDGSSQILHGHIGAVQSVAFAPGDALLASAGDDETIRVWDAKGEEPSIVLASHTGGAYGAVFSRDGKAVLSSGADGILRSTACEVCAPFGEVLRLAVKRADHDVSSLERQRFAPAGG